MSSFAPLRLVSLLALAGCAASAPLETSNASASASAVPTSSATSPPGPRVARPARGPQSSHQMVGEVLECEERATPDCFGNSGFPLDCHYVGKNAADEAKLWQSIWRDGEPHPAFDALDAFDAQNHRRLPDARCLRAGPDSDYNMFDWCCRVE